MGKQDAVLCYKTAVSVFNNWLVGGLITADEFKSIEAKIADKYGLSSHSIYRIKDLLYIGSYGNMQREGGAYEQKNNQN